LFETFQDKLNSLEEINIEEVLNRIDELSSLKNKYGSIEQTLEHLEQKKKELTHYENIEFEKNSLQKEVDVLSNEVTKLCNVLTASRKKQKNNLESLINEYLKMLYLKDISLQISSVELSSNGKDFVDISLNETSLKNISTGELNRTKLAFLAAANKIKLNKNGGFIFLDEVDSNLSGKESMSVANVLKELSCFYQIFAISHQPQLSSQANQHFLVDKNDNLTTITNLKYKDRVNEVARMVSGENISDEAVKLATKLLRAVSY
jgi:DNA repair protein RecN (Recombination protein N)